MLLTVIAVATLLVAVVGATFAYFSLSVTNQSSEVSGKVTTGSVPTITATTENKNLYLSVNSVEMAESAQGSKYYAVASELERNANSQKDLSILKIETEGGETTAQYNCTADIKVDIAGTMLDNLAENDVKLILTNLAGTSDVETIDLYTLKSTDNTTTKKLTWNLEGDTSSELKATVVLENRSADQTLLKDSTLNVTITPSDIKCPIQQAGD